MTTRIIDKLSPELTPILFEAGNRKLVLLEGKDDIEVFEEWFMENLSDICFHAPGGCSNVETFLQETLEKSEKGEVYGIIDRDFRTKQEVNASLSESAHLFILKRYALENYLLEPFAVWEELRIYPSKSFKVADSSAMEKELLKLCEQLKTLIAANSVIYDASTGAKYFKEGYIMSDRANIIQQTSKRLNWELAKVEQKIAEKEIIIQSKLDSIDNAYQMIDGKQLLHQILYQYTDEPKTKIRVEHFRRLLTRTVKEKIGLHTDILWIIKQRILSESQKR
ncbi:MAG TPA: hypothetical protein DCM38_14170 [Gammaproteobacteria bacterium]|nr:hypothetical protein [Gammaproteobacteria bacterium]